jgi:hypothetical protein
VARPPLPESLACAFGIEVGEAKIVAVLDRHERGRDAAGRKQRRDPRGGSRGIVQGKRAAEQRAPREEDRQLVGEALQLRRQPLRRGDDEHGVRAARPGRAPRRLGHRRGVGVDPDDEGSGLRAGPVEDRPAVAGAEVDDDPVGAGDPVL